MKATIPLKTGAACRVGMCGVPYRIKIRDNSLFFIDDGMERCLQFVIYKNDPHGLILIDVRREGRPICHLQRAAIVAEHFLGPNHFRSLHDKHDFEMRYALKNALTRKTYGLGLRLGWRFSCLRRAAWYWWKLNRPDSLNIQWEGGAAAK